MLEIGDDVRDGPGKTIGPVVKGTMMASCPKRGSGVLGGVGGSMRALPFVARVAATVRPRADITRWRAVASGVGIPGSSKAANVVAEGLHTAAPAPLDSFVGVREPAVFERLAPVAALFRLSGNRRPPG